MTKTGVQDARVRRAGEGGGLPAPVPVQRRPRRRPPYPLRPRPRGDPGGGDLQDLHHRGDDA